MLADFEQILRCHGPAHYNPEMLVIGMQAFIIL